jgi:pimeloyl-ACP methyl ester carboxylesterase
MHTGDLFAYATLFAVTPVALGILVYVGVSFALMQRYVEQRPTAHTLREALREVLWAALTQPILPLYYVVGRKLAGGRGTPVVMVHGYAQNRVDFLAIARALARAGQGPVYGFNYPWYSTVHRSAERLARFVEGVRRETGAEQVDLVAHSLGGLVVMEYLFGEGAGRVRRVVTVASPHAGVAWRGPIVGSCGAQIRKGCAFLIERASRTVPVPCLSIYSTHDNIVHPPATSMLATRGAHDRQIPHVGHLSILFAREVARAIVDFLGAPALPEALEPPRELVGA